MTMMSHCPSGLPTKRGLSCDIAVHVVGFWSEVFLIWGPSILCGAAMHLSLCEAVTRVHSCV